MSKKRKHKRIKKLRKIFQQKVASHKEELLEEVKLEENIIEGDVKNEDIKNKESLEKSEKKELGSYISLKTKLKNDSRLSSIKVTAKNFKKNLAQKIKLVKLRFFEGSEKRFKGVKFFLRGISRKITLEGDRAINKIRIYYSKAVDSLIKLNNVFCTRMTCRTNIKRDIIIVSVAIVVAAVFLGMGQYVASLKTQIQDRKEEVIFQKSTAEQFEEKNITEIKTIQDRISAERWKEYKSDWYGFKIKYPQEWKVPVVSSYKRGSLEDYRVSFIVDNQENKDVIGFDVSVYNVNKIKELSFTSEFPKVKNNQLKAEGQCDALVGHIVETGDYPAEEIYIPATDDCYESVLFFSLTNGQYLYNIKPIMRESISSEIDPMVLTSDNLPEFFVAVSQFENIDIIRPKPKPVQPRITAPKPASYKIVNGRMVCEKKNDKPGKSDKGKGKHLDMECCLDPDEYPNPHCYYDSSKYGKYLK